MDQKTILNLNIYLCNSLVFFTLQLHKLLAFMHIFSLVSLLTFCHSFSEYRQLPAFSPGLLTLYWCYASGWGSSSLQVMHPPLWLVIILNPPNYHVLLSVWPLNSYCYFSVVTVTTALNYLYIHLLSFTGTHTKSGTVRTSTTVTTINIIKQRPPEITNKTWDMKYHTLVLPVCWGWVHSESTAPPSWNRGFFYRVTPPTSSSLITGWCYVVPHVHRHPLFRFDLTKISIIPKMLIPMCTFR